MLLDANSPAADKAPAPLPDRPARTDVAPQNRDDPPSSGDPRDSSAAPSTQANSNDANTQEAGDAPGGTKAKDGSDTASANVDANDGTDTATTDASDNGPDAATTTDSGAQLASMLTVIAVANAPAAVSPDTAPAQPANSPSNIAVIPPAAPFAPVIALNTVPDAQAPQTEQVATIEAPSDAQPADTSLPTDPANETAPAESTGATPPAASLSPTSPTKSAEPDDATDAAAPAESNDNPAPAIQTAPADPAKRAQKIVLPLQIDSAAPAEPTAQISAAPPTTAATPATTTPPPKKAALPDGAAPAAADAQAPVKLPSEPAPAMTDSSATNANPANIAAHEQTEKTDATKIDGTNTESQPEDDHPLHLTSGQVPGTEMNAVPASRIGAPANTTLSGPEAMSISGAMMPANQATAAAMPASTTAFPAAAVGVAIPLTALPIEIATQAKDGKNRFEIRLDPPELGRIDVRLDIDSKGVVTSRLMAERPETLDLLRRDAPQIERALQDAGLKTSDQGLQFSLRDQSFADRGDNELPPAAHLVLSEDDTVPLGAVLQGYGRPIGLGGGIDIRV